MAGGDHFRKRHQAIPETGFRFAPGRVNGPGQAFPEGEEAVAFQEFHQGGRFGLRRACALAHLLARGHDRFGVGPAHAQKYRNAETAVVDAAGFGQQGEGKSAKPLSHARERLFRADGLVLVEAIGFAAGSEGNHGGNRREGRMSAPEDPAGAGCSGTSCY